MTSYRIAVLVFLLSACPTAAQPKAGVPQPDRLHVGTVYVGAVVEASFLIREEGKNLDIKLEVEVPKFVRMLKKWNEIKEYGPTNTDFVVGNIEFAIDTAVAGEFKGDISVTLGQAAAKLPV